MLWLFSLKSDLLLYRSKFNWLCVIVSAGWGKMCPVLFAYHVGKTSRERGKKNQQWYKHGGRNLCDRTLPLALRLASQALRTLILWTLGCELDLLYTHYQLWSPVTWMANLVWFFKMPLASGTVQCIAWILHCPIYIVRLAQSCQ